jgi:hypothetical protein
MYNDPTISFQPENFLEFTNVIANTSCRVSQNWVNKLNAGIEHLIFHVIGKSHMVHYVDFIVNMYFGFTRNDLIKLSELSKFNALMHVMCWLKELE